MVLHRSLALKPREGKEYRGQDLYIETPQRGRKQWLRFTKKSIISLIYRNPEEGTET